MEYIVVNSGGKKVSKEEATENPECWWSLDELKKLWPGKLISGGKKAEG